jgi:hypothetical protein
MSTLLMTMDHSQSYVTIDGRTVGQSVLMSSIWGPKPDFYYCETVEELFMWSALSDEKTGL